MDDKGVILALNRGSSSLKFAVYRNDAAGALAVLGTGELERLPPLGPRDLANSSAAADEPLERLAGQVDLDRVAGIGHRVVHGGPRYFRAEIVDPELVAELKRISPLDPDHLPSEIALIEACARRLPQTPQVACFDTAFHHDMPRVASIVPIPRRYEAAGVRRYGFHGLSYQYLLEELRRRAGETVAHGRVILAHLGAGASLAAVSQGQSIDTSMGFTPTSGIPMATRSGDVDPSLVNFLAAHEQMTAEAFDDLVNHHSGLLGVSETSGDMRDLLAAEGTDPRAADAVALFCYQVKKWIGAYAAALGGLDALVFAAGIGERSAVVRQRICSGLEFLGVTLDPARNAASAAVISKDGSTVGVHVIPTDEQLMIARATQQVLSKGAAKS